MERNNNATVCFFDSGIGGLSLLYECVRILPRVDFKYFADNFRVPYGNLTHGELINTVDRIFSEIEKLNPDAAVVACNTVTAQCIDYLRNKYKFEIIGIQPAVKPAAASGSCLVLATPSTADSTSVHRLVEEYGEKRTQVVACPDLAAYIEQNIENLQREGVESFLPAAKADSVVLGCTHYIFAKDIIQNYYNCPVFDGIAGTAARLREKLGIFDHSAPRAQNIGFMGGDTAKNKRIFRLLLTSKEGLSQT